LLSDFFLASDDSVHNRGTEKRVLAIRGNSNLKRHKRFCPPFLNYLSRDAVIGLVFSSIIVLFCFLLARKLRNKEKTRGSPNLRREGIAT
jgi:hypothetical protein